MEDAIIAVSLVATGSVIFVGFIVYVNALLDWLDRPKAP